MRKLLAGGFLVALAFSLPAYADPEPQWFNYTLSGGNITGTLNGISFDSATWTITATADASMVDSPSTSWSPVALIEVVATLTIYDGLETLTTTLSGGGTHYWALTSRDYSFGGPAFGMVGFTIYANGDGSFEGGKSIYIDGASNYNSLTGALELATHSGFDTGTYLTSVGSLVVTADSGANGSFSAAEVSAIPEPSTYAALLGVTVLGATFLHRRRRARVALNA